MKSRFGLSARLAGIALGLTLVLYSFAGCSQVGDIVSGVTAQTGEFPVEIDGVTISSRPQKVTVLSPALADVVLALGCETQLTAGSEDCAQESLRSLTKIDGSNPQAIAGTGPDLVLAGSLDEGVKTSLQEAGITVLEVAPAVDREDFERMYAQVASALLGGGPGYDKGIETAQGIFTTLDDINRIVPKEKIITVCYLYDLESRAVTGDMFGSTIMSYAGATNAFKSLSGGSYDFNTLRMSNPNVIFCPEELRDQILRDRDFWELQAVQNDKVIAMDPSMMEWQGRTVVSAALEISGICFPELTEERSMHVTDPTSNIDSQVSSMMGDPASEPSGTSSEPGSEGNSYSTLQQGDQSEDVLKMQTRLEALGFLDVEYDGHYGEYTAQCVRDFQRVNGLPETGMADGETLKLLYSINAKSKDGNTAE